MIGPVYRFDRVEMVILGEKRPCGDFYLSTDEKWTNGGQIENRYKSVC